jgi:hypothetical protein
VTFCVSSFYGREQLFEAAIVELMVVRTRSMQVNTTRRILVPTSRTPLVSIIIPAYNHARFLPDAIDSALMQTYRKVEIIVVDDGSTDDTRVVAAGYGYRIRYVWQENRGLSSARNTGLQLAKGEFVALLDADDIYKPEFVHTLLNILLADPTLDGVHCSAQTVDVVNEPLPQRIGKGVEPDSFRAKLLEGGYFPPLCMFVRKYCYDRLDQLFDESLTACEDWDMWLRFSTRYRILGIDEPLVRYRVVPGSMSRDPERMIQNRTAVLRKHFEPKPDQQSGETAALDRALARSYLRGAIEHLQAGNEEQAAGYLRQAVLSHPKILGQLETFYLLGQGSQPMGFRNDFSTLKLDHNLPLLLTMLDRLFGDTEVAAKFSGFRRVAYARAFMALGLLSYGARRFKLARRLLLKAALRKPTVVFERQYASILVKTLLGVRLVERLKEVRPVRKSTILPVGFAE